MTIPQIIGLTIALFVVLFSITLAITAGIISSKKEDKQKQLDELTDIYILQSIIKLHDQEHLSLECESYEIKDAFKKFQNVKHRLTVEEINSLVKILYFLEK